MNFLTLEQFTEMWKLQDSLNSVTSGPDWKEKKQNWNLAIKDEVMELFDYIGWKWWKEPDKIKKPSDMQARLELVDIWHFLLSSIIEEAGEIHEDSKGNYQHYLYAVPERETAPSDWKEALQDLDSSSEPLQQKLNLLCAVLLGCEWTWDELYKAYIGKVALNNFRQANGYKAGTYQKIWMYVQDPNDTEFCEEVEDNYFLEQIIQKLKEEGTLTYSNVYNQLEYRYATRPNR